MKNRGLDDVSPKISRQGNCLRIQDKDGKKHILSIENIDEVLITANCSVTIDAMSLCAEKGIPFAVQKNNGDAAWGIETFAGGSAPIIRRKQLTLGHEEVGLKVVKKLQAWKQYNRAAFLKELAWQRGGSRREVLISAAEELISAADRIKVLSGSVDERRSTILGIEGNAGRAYFSALSTIMPSNIHFLGRVTRGAEDIYNSLINYGYGMLYQKIKHDCIHARLDPYIGILHVDQYNRPTLTFDCIEPFRVLAERSAWQCCVEKEPTWSGVIEPAMKKEFIEKMYQQLGKNVRGCSNRTWESEITRSIREIAVLIQSEG